jgi:hypothetical protein
MGPVTVVKLPHYRPHYRNGVCTYHVDIFLSFSSAGILKKLKNIFLIFSNVY